MGIKIRILLIVSMILVGMGSLAQAKVVKHEIKEGWNCNICFDMCSGNSKMKTKA